MNVFEALQKRKSIRAYDTKLVEVEKIKTILEHAKLAPSGVNMQPFDVCVVQGDIKKKLELKMLKAFDNGIKGKMDYEYYPLTWTDPYKSRRKDMGLLMYKTLNITRDDKEKQIRQWRKNYASFGAPVTLYFFIDKNLEKGSYLDYGMFLQSIMLGATELGLSTCPMAALGEYPQIVREELGISDDKVLLCGIALGYENIHDPVNSFKTDRVKLEEFTKFYN